MKISPIKYSNTAFKAANISINAFSDTHGEILLANNALEDMRKRKKNIFFPEKKGNANIIAISGDWFINGGEKGFRTDPKKPLGKFQLNVFNEFINQIKSIAGNTKALFVPGNHEFDGGVKLLDDILSEIDADVIASNLNIDESPAFSKTRNANKIFNERIIEVEDDKNPNLKHKLLFLGIMPVNMQMYQRNLDGVSLTDVSRKNLVNINREDFQNTLDTCKKKIFDFKKDNPDGIVIFMSHAGANFSDTLAQEAPVDLIFDGHEHKKETRIIKNKTPIIPLYMNFKRIVNAKLMIGDDGKLNVIYTNNFDPSRNKTKGPLNSLFKKIFKQDLKKEYSIQANNPEIKVLDVDGIRDGNNFLANFVTDSILHEIRKENPDVDIFALNASAIRHSLFISQSPKNSHLQVKNVLAGISEEAGSVMTTNVTGLELAYMVRDNLIFNSKDPQKNPLVHYSGLIIDKTNLDEEIKKGRPLKYLLRYITDAKTNMPVEADKMYKIANVEKYFDKSKNEVIKNFKQKSEYTGTNIHKLFEQHFEQEKDNLVAKCDVRIL